MAFGETVECLARNEVQGDLSFELDAMGAVRSWLSSSESPAAPVNSQLASCPPSRPHSTRAGLCDHRGRCVRARGDVWASIAPFQFPTARWTSQKLSLGPVWLGLFCAKGLAARCRFPPGRAEWPRRQKESPAFRRGGRKDFARGER